MATSIQRFILKCANPICSSRQSVQSSPDELLHVGPVSQPLCGLTVSTLRVDLEMTVPTVR
jgi:hypothetical protein